jgi:hypothetical protein
MFRASAVSYQPLDERHSSCSWRSTVKVCCAFACFHTLSKSSNELSWILHDDGTSNAFYSQEIVYIPVFFVLGALSEHISCWATLILGCLIRLLYLVILVSGNVTVFSLAVQHFVGAVASSGDIIIFGLLYRMAPRQKFHQSTAYVQLSFISAGITGQALLAVVLSVVYLPLLFF